MAVRRSVKINSIGPVRALALKHVPALILLHRHIDCEWSDIEYAAEQMVAGYWFPKEIDHENKEETEIENENRPYDVTAEWHPTGTESRRRGPEEDEGREIDVQGSD